MESPDINSFALLVPLLLGIIEGLTEFIPVSSTGHLILASHFIDLQGPSVSTFEVFIQLGAILAVVYLYPHRFRALFNFAHAKRLESGRSESGRLESASQPEFAGWNSLMLLGVASLPALIVGALFHKAIKQSLFSSGYVAAALIVGGVLMFAVEKRQSTPRVNRVEDITLKDAFLVGVFQILSLWPGMSRSGSTIVGGLFIGLERQTAAEFSFLISVPIMCAAVSYDLYKSMAILSSADLLPFAIGFVTSFITAVFAIRFFVSLLSKITLVPFAIYRICLGLLVFALLAKGSVWPL